jgi:hypothetical protein
VEPFIKTCSIFNTKQLHIRATTSKKHPTEKEERLGSKVCTNLLSSQGDKCFGFSFFFFFFFLGKINHLFNHSYILEISPEKEDDMNVDQEEE